MPVAVQHEKPREDDELLARVAAGNQSALSELIARHGRGLRTFAARYLGNEGDAEDVVQEVFVTVWKQAVRFDSARGRASTWLYRITANRCIDQRRRQALRTFMGLDDISDEVASREPDAEAATAARQELAIVRDGLSRLPERQRMAVLLRAVGDLDIAAIAEVMGGSVGSAEQLLVRGRRALRDHLAMTAEGRERKSS
ncbi:sigma-70 family RNA polymerase sigma factor [Mesorhizobium sp. YC-39]|uniref:RNA polymerase sigma factor n=1 Tax=unclassified Mesorhizobium TaxID=325217 RepID=UPI0021E8CE78|nr:MULTISPECIES: sigma-70 family RNA polymerase sigma factor [unclassified Mesorhizobium]MCV3209375.1 sigma-70 family RNA polymerase sigma factor [Mesorhizobium sp. YC-2]MCV3231275.1 sigma-70 family RNA polymerase sigma factor [Mesorhizobium sp. YC-39]